HDRSDKIRDCQRAARSPGGQPTGRWRQTTNHSPGGPDGLGFYSTLVHQRQVVFRGADFAPPDQVKGVVLKRRGGDLEISWGRCRYLDWTADYRVYVDRRQVGETEGLSLQLWASTAIDRPLTVVAHDRQGNASVPSEPVYVCGGR